MAKVLTIPCFRYFFRLAAKRHTQGSEQPDFDFLVKASCGYAGALGAKAATTDATFVPRVGVSKFLAAYVPHFEGFVVGGGEQKFASVRKTKGSNFVVVGFPPGFDLGVLRIAQANCVVAAGACQYWFAGRKTEGIDPLAVSLNLMKFFTGFYVPDLYFSLLFVVVSAAACQKFPRRGKREGRDFVAACSEGSDKFSGSELPEANGFVGCTRGKDFARRAKSKACNGFFVCFQAAGRFFASCVPNMAGVIAAGSTNKFAAGAKG